MSEESEPKVSFVACLRHETRKTFWPYVLFVSKVIDLLAAVGIVALVLMVSWDTLAAIQDAIYKFIYNIAAAAFEIAVGILSAIIVAIWGIVVAMPWWGYVIAGIVLLVTVPPVIYAAGICINRRYGIDGKRVMETALECYGTIATVVYLIATLAFGLDQAMRGIYISLEVAVVMAVTNLVLLSVVLLLGTFFMGMWALSRTINGKHPYEVGAGSLLDTDKDKVLPRTLRRDQL